MRLTVRKPTSSFIITALLTLFLYAIVSTCLRHAGNKYQRVPENQEQEPRASEINANLGQVDSRPSPKRKKVISIPKPLTPTPPARKANATFVMLVRNKDLEGARSAVRQIEDRFNRQYQYPYVFLNNEPFSKQFEHMMRTMSSANMTFAQIPKEHWSYPDWIDQEEAAETRERMRKLVYGWSESYRHMCSVAGTDTGFNLASFTDKKRYSHTTTIGVLSQMS
ncbi:alpha 1,2-mannosyltransferase 2.4.1, partial [Podila epigama]